MRHSFSNDQSCCFVISCANNSKFAFKCNEGAEIQPNGTIQITLPALQQEFDADNVMVVYISPDGSYQECKTTVNEDGTITFETDHFSRYAVIEITNSTPAIVWILISTISVVLIAGAVVAVIFIKKKKGIA